MITFTDICKTMVDRALLLSRRLTDPRSGCCKAINAFTILGNEEARKTLILQE